MAERETDKSRKGVRDLERLQRRGRRETQKQIATEILEAIERTNSMGEQEREECWSDRADCLFRRHRQVWRGRDIDFSHTPLFSTPSPVPPSCSSSPLFSRLLRNKPQPL